VFVGCFLLSATTTPWPQVSFRMSQVLRYTFPSLPQTGPSRSAPVQLSGQPCAHQAPHISMRALITSVGWQTACFVFIRFLLVPQLNLSEKGKMKQSPLTLPEKSILKG